MDRDFPVKNDLIVFMKLVLHLSQVSRYRTGVTRAR